MSAWRICLKALADAGGGPLTEHDLLMLGANVPEEGRMWQAFWQAKKLGYVDSDEPGHGYVRTKWWVTPLGWELVQGRVERRVMRAHLTATGLMRRSRVETVATWLRALPPPNTIRLESAPCEAQK